MTPHIIFHLKKGFDLLTEKEKKGLKRKKEGEERREVREEGALLVSSPGLQEISIPKCKSFESLKNEKVLKDLYSEKLQYTHERS